MGPSIRSRRRPPPPLLLAAALIVLLAGGTGAAAELRGTIYGSNWARQPGILVRALDQPTLADSTDAQGGYLLVLPTTGSWRIEARGEGFAPQWLEVEIAASTHQDFWMLAQVVDGFESGDLASYPWQVAGALRWAAVAQNPAAGTWCARSGDVGNQLTSVLQTTLQAAQNSEVSFRLRVSSEAGYDGLAFLIDGQELGFWSGEVGWTEQVFPVTAGPHLLAWIWRKDEAVSLGEDAAWLDEVRFPALGALQVPELRLEFDSLQLEAQQGEMSARVERIGNAGHAPLDFQFEFGPPDLGGGPDAAGYVWTDSDLPGGPAHEWIELIGTGQVAVPPDDEAVWGPFDLGFAFPFYGEFHDRVWICANGFLSFGDTLGDYRNLGLPDAAAPNGLIAPFWDDLDPSAGGMVLWRRDVAEQRFIVQWQSLPHYSFSGTGPPETFQAILHADGRILFQYAVVSLPAGCSVGIEDQEGLIGLQVARDEPYLHAGLSVLIRPIQPPGWISAAPASGTVPPDGAQLVVFTCDAADLPLGLHLATAILRTNDSAAALLRLPVRLQVVSDLTGVEPPALSGPRLLPPRPNPANPRTLLSFRLPAAAAVTLRLYDAAGRLVRTLAEGELAAGEHAYAWDGRDGRGRAVASGVFLARLSWAGGREVQRVVLVR